MTSAEIALWLIAAGIGVIAVGLTTLGCRFLTRFEEASSLIYCVEQRLVSMDAEVARCAEGLTDAIPARLDRLADRMAEFPGATSPDSLEVDHVLVRAGETTRQAAQRVLNTQTENVRRLKSRSAIDNVQFDPPRD